MTTPAGTYGKRAIPHILPGEAHTKVRRAIRELAGLTNAPGLNATGNVLQGTFADLPPVAANPSTVYFCTDVDILFVSDPAGTVWSPYEPVHELDLPTASEFAWLNQGTATVAFDPRMILQDTGNNDPTTSKFSAQIQPVLNGAPPWTAVQLSRVNLGVPEGTSAGTSVLNNAGIVGYDSVSGKLLTWGIAWRYDLRATCFLLDYWNNTTNPTTDLILQPIPPISSPFWLSMEDDGTNRLFGYSVDSNNFNVIYSEARTAHSMTVDHVGPYLNPIGATLNQRITHTVYSFFQN